jgi:hypothetical protein
VPKSRSRSAERPEIKRCADQETGGCGRARSGPVKEIGWSGAPRYLSSAVFDSPPTGTKGKNGIMAPPNDELDSYNKLIRVLEDALEAAAGILGSEARPPLRSRYEALDQAAEVYSGLSDLLEAARAGRMRFLERRSG